MMKKPNGTRGVTALRLILTAVVVLATGNGCGLLDDATKLTIDTGWKQVTVDSASMGIAVPTGSSIPGVPCDQSADVCSAASAGLSCSSDTYACELKCGAQKTCEIVISAELANTVDVSDKVKNQTSASALSKVSFNYMLFRVPQNTLTFATPELAIFVGPQSATKTTDPGVIRFATMEAIPAGATPDGQVTATEDGKSALAAFVKDYNTPFKMFASSTITFASGDPLPSGKLTLEVNGFFEIEPL